MMNLFLVIGPAWMMPFNIVELVLHKKYNLKGTNKQVGIKDREFKHFNNMIRAR